MRAHLTTAVASVFLLAVAMSAAAAPARSATNNKLYYDYTVGLRASQMETTAAGLNAVADALSNVCAGITDVKTAIRRIRVTGRAAWIKRGASLLLNAHILAGVDSACDASRKYRWAAIGLLGQARFLYPNCSLWERFCNFTASFRRRLEKVERRLRFDYCRLTLWPSGTGLGARRTVIRYSADGGCL